MRNHRCTSWMRAIPALRQAVIPAVVLALALFSLRLSAQLATTTVQGTIYRADGSPAAGTLLVSWSAFTTSANQAVAAGNVSTVIGADGFVSLQLTPNAGAAPAGSYYTAVYHLSDGTVNTEYWVVPAAGTASIASIRAQLQPATVAVQSVSENYVDNAVTALADASLPVSGGVMTGPLSLSTDPTSPSQAATKHYADQLAAANLPLSGGSLTGPLNGINATFSGTLSAAGTSVGTRGTVSVASQAALVAAIAKYCSGAAPGHLALAPGQSITVSSWIAIPANCTVDWGGATLTQAAAANATLLYLNGVSGVHFRGALYLNGNGAQQTAGTYAQLLALNNVTDSDFDKIYASNAVDTCISLSNSSRNKFALVDARNCGVSALANPNYQGTSLFLNPGSADNEFGQVYTDTSSGQGNIVILGTTADPSPRNKIDRYTAVNAARKAVTVLGAAPYTTLGPGYIAADAANTNAAGMYISASDGSPDYINVGNVTAFNCGNNCFELSGNNGTYGNLVSNTTVFATGGGYGFYLGGNNNTFAALSAFNSAGDGVGIFGSNNTIASLITEDNGSRATGTYAGLHISGYLGGGTGNIVSSIIARNVNTANQAFGIEETNGAAGNTYAVARIGGNSAASSTGLSSSSVLQPATNTYGCLQGYDSLPCAIVSNTSTANAAPISGANLLAAAPAGKYRISCMILLTQPAAGGVSPGSTLPLCQAYWTDPTGNTAFAAITSTTTANTAGTVELQFPAYADVETGSTVGFQVVGYQSTGTTPMQYKASVLLERVQ